MAEPLDDGSARAVTRRPPPVSAFVRRRATVLVFLAMWSVGIAALAVVLGFGARVDTARQAQIVVEAMQRQVGDLAGAAFDPATAARGAAPTAAETQRTMEADRRLIDRSLATLGKLGESHERNRLERLDRACFASIERIAALVRGGAGKQAALQFGRDSAANEPYGALLGELRRASVTYDRSAARARNRGAIGIVAATIFVLLAFSLTLGRATRLARDKHRLLEQSRVEALTDALTGLPNRRKLFADLRGLLADGAAPTALALGMFDLDGFKAYNDSFGHPAGDALLARAGRRLAEALEGLGVAYRMGGDEFCVVVTAPDPMPVIAAAAAALSEHGDGFDVSCSYGSVVVASEQVTIEEVMQRADQRLYENKRSPRPSAGSELHDVLLTVLAEKSRSLASHATNVANLAEAVAHELGLSGDDIALVRSTAELHDVGKAAIPNTILDKPGPLDQPEWEFMRRHTIIGERILNAAPALARVAPLVRSTHEWYDGTGYPDGMKGDAIPLSARIVSVVDAYDAMTHDRPYRRAVSPARTLDELRRCSGTQFDPAVVAAFIAVHGRLGAEDAGPGRGVAVAA